jgi:NhaP-type Na+/H+ or K+/H+ antiporter
VMVVKEQLPGGDIVVATAACTILLSVVAHGLSANPLVSIYSSRVGEGPI